MPLARAYMSGQSAEDYRRLFETLFNCLQKNGVTIQWKYAEGEGVVGVTVDQDAGCIKGMLTMRHRFYFRQTANYVIRIGSLFGE